jgi:hypothetical protein
MTGPAPLKALPLPKAQAAWEQASLLVLVRACLKGQLAPFQALDLDPEQIHPRWKKLAATFQRLPSDVDALPGLAGVDVELAKSTAALAGEHDFAVVGQSLPNLAGEMRRAALQVSLARAWDARDAGQAMELFQQLEQDEPGARGDAP